MCVCLYARASNYLSCQSCHALFFKLVDFGKVFVSVVSQLVVSVAKVGYTHAHA